MKILNSLVSPNLKFLERRQYFNRKLTIFTDVDVTLYLPRNSITLYDMALSTENSDVI